MFYNKNWNRGTPFDKCSLFTILLMNKCSAFWVCLVLFGLSGCYSIPEINQAFAAVDRVYQQEYEAGEDQFRRRVVGEPPDKVFDAVKAALVQSKMTIVSESRIAGIISAEARAPTPLSTAEWGEVIRTEDPRARKLSGGALYFLPDPSQYLVIIRIILGQLPSGGTLVTLHFRTDNPTIRSRGMIGLQYPPPTAMRLGTDRFWSSLDGVLSDRKMPTVKRLETTDLKIRAPESRPVETPEKSEIPFQEHTERAIQLEKVGKLCRDLGFIEKTEKFGECVLKLSR